MPNAIPADWPLIQQLYMAGTPIADIASQTGVKQGTIAGRASRARWRDVATRAKSIVQNAMVEPKADSASESKLGASSERTRTRLARLVERSAEKIEEMTLRSPAHALRVNSELESVVRNAKTVFGWSDSTSTPAVRISIMSQATLVKVDTLAPSPLPSEPVCIELEPSPPNAPCDASPVVVDSPPQEAQSTGH